MSEIFFTDASEAPVPPEEVRIRELEAAPRPDGRRVDVLTALTPFQRRPNIEISIRNDQGQEAASLSVVEALEARMDFTMHLREAQTGGRYAVHMRVFYSDIEQHEATEGEDVSASELLERAVNVVDERRAAFEIPTSEN